MTAGNYLVVVRRGETRRFAVLADAFASEPEVTILWDRRQGERRQAQGLAVERRSGRDRRGAVPFTWSALDFLVTSGGVTR